MMGEMLGFVDSKSKPYLLKNSGVVAFPDENYAREVMQLFSVGVHLLNMDGTKKLDADGLPILVSICYHNHNQNFWKDYAYPFCYYRLFHRHMMPPIFKTLPELGQVLTIPIVGQIMKLSTGIQIVWIL